MVVLARAKIPNPRLRNEKIRTGKRIVIAVSVRKERKSARNPLGTECQAFVAMRASRNCDFEQMAVSPVFGSILGMDSDDAGDDRGKKLVSAPGILAAREHFPFRFR